MLVKSLSGGQSECRHSLSADEILFNFLNPENDFVVRVIVRN